MPQWLEQAKAIDAAVYAAIAEVEAPDVDAAMRRLSRTADHSKLWFGAAAALALLGGPSGRRAAHALPALSAPLRAIATLVGYSRIHTGVHFPADVLAGAFLGVSAAEIANRVLDHRKPAAS